MIGRMIADSPCKICLQEDMQSSHCGQHVAELSLCAVTLHRSRRADHAAPCMFSTLTLFGLKVADDDDLRQATAPQPHPIDMIDMEV